MSQQGLASSFNSGLRRGVAVWLSQLISGESKERKATRVEGRSRSVVITTATTTNVTFHAGIISSIRVLGGVVGNVTIYDSFGASGKVLLPALTPVAGVELLRGVEFVKGLTIVTASAIFLVVEYDELNGRVDL